jgi:prevent-host-death family protein
MDTVGIAEIKRNISSVINCVTFGRERIILTSRGKPRAALVSIEDLQKLEAMESASPPPSRAQRKAALAMAQAVRDQ